MKHIALFFFVIICISNACVSKSDAKKTLQTHKEAVDTLRLAQVNDSTIHYKPLPLKELETVDLSELLVSSEEYGAYSNLFNGFFGEDHYRIEFYWYEAKKDSALANVYHLKGKTRFKENISDFTGVLTIDSIFQFADPYIDYDAYFSYDSTGGKYISYQIRGGLMMQEDSNDTHAGIFKGDFVMDYTKNEKGITELWYYSPQSLTKGSGFKSEGIWTYNDGKLVKPYVFGKDFFMFANGILADFSFGERDIEINPKYLHLGWENFWESGEWWEEKPL